MKETITIVYHDDSMTIYLSNLFGYYLIYKNNSYRIYLPRDFDIDDFVRHINFYKLMLDFGYEDGFKDGFKDGRNQLKHELKNIFCEEE